MSPLTRSLEALAFDAWPAEEVRELSGWRLRFNHGVTNRANSVWPNASDGDAPLAMRVREVEAFYRARGVAAQFQMTTAAEPAGLDAFLAERGYAVRLPVSVQTVVVDAFRFAGQPPRLTTRVSSTPDDAWFHVAVDRGRFAGKKSPYAGILARLGSRGGFAVARSGTDPVAIGLGVVDGEWLGVFNMATLPEFRRQYAASAILAALVGWASARGAVRAYLQVEEDNAAALALYRSSGFAPEYRYHYRTLEETRSTLERS